MTSVMSVLSSLACAVSLNAQISATLNRSNGLDEVRIRNNSATSLVAFVVTVNQAPRSDFSSNAPFVLYSDPLVDPASKPLPPGEDRLVIARGVGFSEPKAPGVKPSARRILEEPIITAGILADGATIGDRTLLGRLMMRRANMLLAAEMALETLLDAGRRNVPRDQLIRQFQKMVDSVRRWYLPPEQRVARDLYQSIIGKLVNLPEGPVGSPFPPTTFVEQETARLNRQRVTLLESQPSLTDANLIETGMGLMISQARTSSSKAAKAAEWLSLFDGQSLEGWRNTPFTGHGEVRVTKGFIELGAGKPMTGVTLTGSFPQSDYEFRFEGVRLAGNDFFASVTFPVLDSFCTLVTGGWGGDIVGLSSIDGWDASDNETRTYFNFETGRWYAFNVQVTGDRIRVWIDGKPVINVAIAGRSISLRPGEIKLSVPFGFASYGTVGGVRKIEYRLMKSLAGRQD